jgi:sulfate adenylyltransferase
MKSSNANRALYTDYEALATLQMLKSGTFFPLTSLMDEEEARQVDDSGEYRGKKVPFSMIFAPSGKRNEKVLKGAKKGDVLELLIDSSKVGSIVVDKVYKIDKAKRIQQIYATLDESHPGVRNTMKRLGEYAVAGELDVDTREVQAIEELIQERKKSLGAKRVAAMMLSAKPLNRAHERLIRSTLEKNDLLVLFLLRDYEKEGGIPYELREKTLKYFVDHFLQKDRVIIAPLESTYIFAGYNNVLLDSIVAKNFGCNKLVIGENHAGLGRYHGDGTFRSSAYFSKSVQDDIEIENVSEFVYCDRCTTLVSNETCPHGKHHHVSYNSESIEQLVINGILPPAVLVRKEISAILLSSLFPNRIKDINKLFYDLIPCHGFVEAKSDEDLYLELIKLHQTTSLS